MTIGARILEIRQAASLPQKEFAEQLGVSKSAVASYEKDQQMPGAAVLMSVCEHFNVEPRWLLLGEGQTYSDKTIEKMGANLNRHNENVEATEARVKEMEQELERIKKELLAAQMERDRAKDEAYKAMKVALKAHGTDIDLE